MKHVITFSLWGDNPLYNIGVIRNVELAKNVYPDFECWVYIHKESVPSESIIKLQEFNNTKIILKSGDINICKPRMWRFEAIIEPDVEVMLSRDTDSRFTLREQLAVKEWLNSNKTFHIMRDHPCHNFEIMAGMFGVKKNDSIAWKELMDNFIPQDSYFYDQIFLRDFIYPLIKEDAVIHASFHKKEHNCISFPIPYQLDLKFVGEYIYADESRNQSHIHELYVNIIRAYK